MSGLRESSNARTCPRCKVEELGSEQNVCAWCEPVATLEAELERARAAVQAGQKLAAYAQHHQLCDVLVNSSNGWLKTERCTCGLEQTLGAHLAAMVSYESGGTLAEERAHV